MMSRCALAMWQGRDNKFSQVALSMLLEVNACLVMMEKVTAMLEVVVFIAWR